MFCDVQKIGLLDHRATKFHTKETFARGGCAYDCHNRTLLQEAKLFALRGLTIQRKEEKDQHLQQQTISHVE